ncbi:MAG: GNAT family N-acetyltransferase [Treponema sp.]|nr:GNAT family N-acetyltransferase [Treponema sp.]
MNFLQVDESNRAAVFRFLSRHEHTCVQLVERVRLRKFDGIFAILDNARTVTGVLSVRHTVLHCLPDARDKKKQAAFKIRLAEFLCDKKISCVNGEAVSSSLIIDMLSEQNKTPLQVNEYQLMTLRSTVLKNTQNASPSKQSRFMHSVLPNWHVVCCCENDADALMPLQAAYETEEVTPACRETNAAVVRKNLERLLQTEYVIALQNACGEFVAKAHTNAIGVNYAQIGGVYTMPHYRDRHYASLLVEIMVQHIVQSKRRPVLYVRTANEQAKKIYASLGFAKSLGYTIAYF